MSQTVKDSNPSPAVEHHEVLTKDRASKPVDNYKGFVAGVFSGIAKLSGTLELELILKAGPDISYSGTSVGTSNSLEAQKQ